MLICHKLVVSNEAAVLQACHVSPSRRACNIGSVCHASVVSGCVPLSASSSLIYHFWFLKHHHSAATPHHYNRWETQLLYPWKLNACRANNNYFPYIFCSLYLLLFLIVLYRTIVTVYTDNICIYNYLWQMHQNYNSSFTGGVFYPSPR